MRFIKIISLLVLLAFGASANADTPVSSNQNLQNNAIYNVKAPNSSPVPATSPELHGGHSANSILVSQTGLVTDVVCGTFGFVPQSNGSNIVCALLSGSSITGTANTIGYFGSGGLLGSITPDGTSISVISGTTLQRNALTFSGAVVGTMSAGSSSLALTFGSAPPLGTLANATNSSAVPTFVSPATGSQFWGSNPGNTALAFQALTPVSAGTVATWSTTGIRVFAVNPSGGSDSHACWADSADLTQPNEATATQTAGGNACATLAGAAAEIPPVGNGRNVLVVVYGGATTYTDPWTVFGSQLSGYNTKIVRATATNTTAGATAFAGDAVDLAFSGAQTCTGMNAAGYNAAAGTGNTLTSVTKVGGGSPSFAGEPARPLFCRLRFDAATTTPGLRNTIYSVVAVPGSGSLTISSSITVASGDTFYLEEAGAIAPGGTFGPDLAILGLTGLQTSTTLGFRGAGAIVSFMSATGLFFSGTGSVLTLNTSPQAPSPTVGPTLVTGTVTGSSGGSFSASTSTVGIYGNATFVSATSLGIADNDVIGGNVTITGGSSGGSGFRIGGSLGVSTSMRVLGNISLNQTNVQLVFINLPSTSQASGIKVGDNTDVRIDGIISGGTKTLAGIDFSLAYNSRIRFSAFWQPTVTGSAGDTYWGNSYLSNSPPSNIIWSYAGMWTWAGNARGNTFIMPQGTIVTIPATDGSIAFEYPIQPLVVVQNYGFGSTIPMGSVVRFLFTDGVAAVPALADNTTHVSKGLGVVVDNIPNLASSFAVLSGQAVVVLHDTTDTGCTALTNGGNLVFVSAVQAGTFTCTRPAIARSLGWTIGEQTINLLPSVEQEPISTISVGGTTVNTEPGFNFIFPTGTPTVADNTGSARTDLTLPAWLVDPGSNGILSRTALGIVTPRSIQPGVGVTITNGDGVAGNPTISASTATVYTDGIITGATQLASVAAATITAGTIAYTNSVDDYFKLTADTTTPDSITHVAASGKAGFEWVRMGIVSLRSQAITTWFLDPSGTCNDENTGASGHALCTFKELARRVHGANYQTTITYNLLSNSQIGDSTNFDITINGGSVTILGTLTPIYSGTVTSYTAHSTTAAVDDNELVDSGIPTSYTASGLLTDGLLFYRTNSTGVYWWGVKDLGSKTLRTSDPTGPTGLGVTALSPGDTYAVSALPSINQIRFQANATGQSSDGNITFNQLTINDPFGSYGNITLQMCAFLSSALQPPQVAATRVQNVSFGQSVNLYGTVGSGSIWNSGLVKGSGVSSIVGGVSQVGRVTFQGGRLASGQQANTLVPTRLSFYDNTTPGAELLLVRDNSNITLTGAIGGSGNTVAIIDLRSHGQVYYNGATTIFVSGITSSSAPFVIEPTSYPFSAIPIANANGESMIVDYTAQPAGIGILSSNGSGIQTAFSVGATRVPFGSGVNGQLTDDALFTYSFTNHALAVGGTAISNAAATIVSTNSNNPRNIINWQAANDTTAALYVGRKSRGTQASPSAVATSDVITNFLPEAYDGSAFQQTGSSAFIVDGTVTSGSVPTAYQINTGSTGRGTQRLGISSVGVVTWPNITSFSISSLGSAGTTLVQADPTGVLGNVTIGAGLSLSSGTLSAVGGGTITNVTATLPVASSGGATPNITLNYDNSSINLNGSNQIQIGTIPTAQLFAGYYNLAQVTAPSSPASGHTFVWSDSTFGGLWNKTNAGTPSHTIQTYTCGANQFTTAANDNGTSTCAQPGFTNIAGTVSATQLGTFTNGSILYWNGGLAQDTGFSWDHSTRTMTVAGSLVNGDGTTASTMVSISTSSSTAGLQVWHDATPNTAVGFGMGTPGTAPDADLHLSTYSTGGGWNDRVVIPNSGGMRILNLSAGGLVKATPSSALLAIASGSDVAAALPPSGVTAGTYVTPTITVDATGRVTAASFTNTYQVVENQGTPVTSEAVLNFISPLQAADSGGSPFRTNVTFVPPSGLLLGASGSLTTATIGTCLTLSSGTLDLSTGTCGGTSVFGGTDKLLQSITEDGYGKFVSGTTINMPQEINWGGGFVNSSFGLPSSMGSILFPMADTGNVETNMGLITTVSSDVGDTLNSAYATSAYPLLYTTRRAYAKGSFQCSLWYENGSGSGGPDQETWALYYTTNPSTASVTNLATITSSNLGSVRGSLGTANFTASIPSGAYIFMVVYRTDSASSLFILNFHYRCQAELY